MTIKVGPTPLENGQALGGDMSPTTAPWVLKAGYIVRLPGVLLAA